MSKTFWRPCFLCSTAGSQCLPSLNQHLLTNGSKCECDQSTRRYSNGTGPEDSRRPSIYGSGRELMQIHRFAVWICGNGVVNFVLRRRGRRSTSRLRSGPQVLALLYR